ncbi:hypothetical protein PHJA_002652300 [Phtheirospermum japonicum]|uniref:Uncharacterized protein n=1 Tax=Phtheirospermum japonicum TaxID=374723 RepID=A0A830DG10_9LAMI|nr:hypothetical protein PHJA_002652300 [Phtheirospermum japonicum]
MSSAMVIQYGSKLDFDCNHCTIPLSSTSTKTFLQFSWDDVTKDCLIARSKASSGPAKKSLKVYQALIICYPRSFATPPSPVPSFQARKH